MNLYDGEHDLSEFYHEVKKYESNIPNFGETDITKFKYGQSNLNTQIYTLIFRENADEENFKNFLNNISEETIYEFTKLVASAGKIKLFLAIIRSYDISINFENNILLNIAILYKSVQIVEYLVKSGADVTSNNNLAIKLASRVNYNDYIIQILIDNGSNVHVQDDFPVRMAAYAADFDNIKVLVKNGADIHSKNDFVLRYISHMSYICRTLDTTYGSDKDKYFSDIIKYLVENGANIHADDEYALKISITRGRFRAVQILLEAGADIRSLNASYLLRAITSRKDDIFELLIEYGINLSMINNYQNTILEPSTAIINKVCDLGVDPKKLAEMMHYIICEFFNEKIENYITNNI
ncbi:MAG: putative ankyrin repeat protein [Satyrvirus sp.]|uniref:Putative ankyrin repeat protein n=1 Tax=Satyrvirus sp. TaxID=2487771 RepID=A0A3G5AD04_9VIRU|nr:MAG: putative ankyrin repeat protein [Satyrvirus sp.]